MNDRRSNLYQRLFTLNEPRLLVLSLALPRPVRRNINPILLFLIALFFRLVDCGRLVLRRAVYSVQDQWIRTCVDKLMLRPRRNNDKVSCFYILVLACDGGLACAGCEGQDLIDGVFLQFVSGS